MRRILFVDDEPRVLEGLRRTLRAQRGQWEMVFAPGGEAALAALQRAPFDVVVSDMRMPQVDGAALLARVRAQHPHAVRIVLSGQTELDAALRAVPFAHQYLTKPCDAAIIKDAIDRACHLQTLLEDGALRRIVGAMDTLPCVPRLYTSLTQALAAPEVSLARVTEIVEQDAAMCAKILQLVNSAFFGVARRVSDVGTALNYLGTTMLKNLVLSVEVVRTFESSGRLTSAFLEAGQRHAVVTAGTARRLLNDRHQAEEAFMAGMLHDVGQLILASRLPSYFERVQAAARDTGRPPHEVEAEQSGVTHAEIGAYLLGLWGLPYAIVEAVAHHHAPARVARRSWDVVGAVYVANGLAHEQDGGAGGALPLDLPYLQGLGVAGQLPAWRSTAAEQARAAA